MDFLSCLGESEFTSPEDWERSVVRQNGDRLSQRGRKFPLLRWWLEPGQALPLCWKLKDEIGNIRGGVSSSVGPGPGKHTMSLACCRPPDLPPDSRGD